MIAGLHHYEADGGIEVIEAGAELDVYNVSPLREAAITVTSTLGRRYLVIDLTRTVYLDFTGLGAVIGALKRVRTLDGHMAIACADGRVLKIFQITGLTRIFTIRPHVDQAAQSVRQAIADSQPAVRNSPGGTS